MSHKDDLAERIRTSSRIVVEYEQIRQLSADPKEKRRAELSIAEQRELIKDYWGEYRLLCEQLSLAPDRDILEIAVAAGLSLPSAMQPLPLVTVPLTQLTPDVSGTVLHALIVGVASYRHLQPLSKTTVDAQDLYQILLHQGYSAADIAILLDSDATKPAISERLDWLARQVGPHDTAVIFFSGHGAQLIGGFWPGEYLCPVEASLDKVRDTFISGEELTTALRAIRAGRLVVFLDACHAGGVGEARDTAVQVRSGLSEAGYSSLVVGEGRVVIASCRPDEASYEFPEMRNGLFTHYLLEGLRGGAARQDGAIWMSNLFGFVYEHVSQRVIQHPFQKSAAEDFVITRARQP